MNLATRLVRGARAPSIHSVRGVVLLAASLGIEDELALEFAPRDNTRYVEDIDSTVVTQYEDRVTEETTHTRTGFLIVAGEDEFRVTSRLLEVDRGYGGQAAASPVADMMLNRKIIRRMGPDGAMKSGEGYLSYPFDDGHEQECRDIIEWRGRVEFFAGKTVEEGHHWINIVPVALPGHFETEVVIEYAFENVREEDGLTVVDIVYAFDVCGPGRYGDDESLRSAFQPAEVPVGQPWYQGGGRRVVEAATLICLREESWTRMSQTLAVGNEVVHALRTERVVRAVSRYRWP